MKETIPNDMFLGLDLNEYRKPHSEVEMVGMVATTIATYEPHNLTAAEIAADFHEGRTYCFQPYEEFTSTTPIDYWAILFTSRPLHVYFIYEARRYRIAVDEIDSQALYHLAQDDYRTDLAGVWSTGFVPHSTLFPNDRGN